MLARYISMRKLREILRLKFSVQLSHRQIAAATQTSPSSVSCYARAATAAGIGWPLDPEMDDLKLLQLLMPHCKQIVSPRRLKCRPNLMDIFTEMQHKHVTLQLLWEEYKTQYPEQYYSYSNFCLMYRTWCKGNKISMKQTHKAGDKCFIDYAGTTIPIYDRVSNIIIKAQLFIAVLGLSNFTYVEATATQNLLDWLSSHVRAFEFFNGVPSLLVPDNLKSGIKDSCKYAPIANPSYTELAIHYNTTILPARPYSPKDKAKAEVGVQIAERWIIAKLRHMKFYSIEELNIFIRELLQQLNQKKFKKKDGSRYSQFIELEQPALRQLPKKRYEQAYFKQLTVAKDYHVELEHHYYSVPYQYANEAVECRYTQTTVEILYQHKRITSHIRSYVNGGVTTLSEHMPAAHRAHHMWNIQQFIKWSENIGDGVTNAVNIILTKHRHTDQIYRIYLGFKQLVKCYGTGRLNNACLRATAINCVCYRSISSILKQNLDQQPFVKNLIKPNPIKHSNIRGSDYYKNF